jgi:uncharacterized membrane protein
MIDPRTIVAQAQAAVAARHRKDRKMLPLWLGIAIGVLVAFNGLPFLAPVFMKLGWEGAGRIIYMIYSGLCHQMAQRSFFLFGSGGIQMHNIADLPINLAGLNTGEQIVALRRFIGNDAFGWKVAWSDRMVYMYVTPLLLAVGYAILRRFKRIKPLPLWAFFLLLLPMAIDGGSHWVSDLAGIGQGFRYTNTWLASLTGGVFPNSFYVGDAFGSFNAWMRLLSGFAFGLGVVGLAFPYMEVVTPNRREEPESANSPIIPKQMEYL